MSFTSQRLPNGGRTEHYQIAYDDALSQADGLDRALGLVATCEQDFSLMQSWFFGVDVTHLLPMEVRIANASGGAS